jgi:putative acetyltransferase
MKFAFRDARVRVVRAHMLPTNPASIRVPEKCGFLPIGEALDQEDGVVEDGQIVGHIMFSPVELVDSPARKIMGLAPMAVVPGHQRQGIGSALVRRGLEECNKLGFVAVVVSGHAEYYPRFGFVPSSRFGIGCEYDVPAELFMAIELQPAALRDASGTIKYHRAFQGV